MESAGYGARNYLQINPFEKTAIIELLGEVLKQRFNMDVELTKESVKQALKRLYTSQTGQQVEEDETDFIHYVNTTLCEYIEHKFSTC